MKVAGYIITTIGLLALIGSFYGGSSPIGPLFWIAIGIFLLLKARRKREDKDKLDKWNNSDQEKNV